MVATIHGISMSDLAPDLFGHAGATVPASQRSRVTNDPVRRQKGTTAAGRRLRDLYLGYLAALGNPTDIVAQTNCLKAAELVQAAEDARAALLAGKGDANAVVRLENLADRAVRRLGLPPAGEQRLTLRERLAAKADAPSISAPVSLRERLAGMAHAAVAEVA